MSHAAPKVAPAPRNEVPPLANGDHLSRPEFERRYDATPGLKKAELIEGVVYMPPPVSHPDHGRPHFDLIALFGQYRFATPGIEGGDNGSIRLDLENMPQPDIYLLIDPARGGQSQISDDGYVEGAPEFVCEVAATSASIDLHRKLRLYRRSGVKEYMVWRALDERIDYFIERGGEYEPLTPAEDGTFRSVVLPGLWIDAGSIIRGDWPTAVGKLRDGLASPEQAEFVARLMRNA